MKNRLNEFIEFMEGFLPNLDEDGQLELPLPLLEDSFLKCSAKDKIMLYLNAKEYQEPKRQRTSINENDNELPDDIYNQ
jgi:hypothetical protein